MKRMFFAWLAVALMLLTPAQALPTDHRDAALAGADRLLDVQFADGSMPWMVGSGGSFQNVQGISAYGLLEAYKLSLDAKYLGDDQSGAQGVRYWLSEYMANDPSAFISSSNAFFLAEYAMITLDTADLDLAREALDRAVDRFGNGTALVEGIVQSRANQGHTNMGIWDAALFVRAAQDVGNASLADEMAAALAGQDIVDAFDNTSNWYELGLTGILFALAEADAVAYAPTILAARDALVATQCADGSYPAMWQGVSYCGEVQGTAYAIIGLSMVLDVVSMQGACDFLASTQQEDGGWDLGGYEVAEVDSEAVMALTQCVAPANNAVTSYADPVRGLL